MLTEALPLDSRPWPPKYASPPDNLVNDFYRPAFRRSTVYWRAAGYFSADLLLKLFHGLDDFLLGGGRIRLIISPANLSDEDLAAFGKGEEELQERLRTDLIEAIEAVEFPDGLKSDKLRLITWMVSQGRLDVKLALREYSDCYALFHEKFGVFFDPEGNRLSFVGSNNETIGGGELNAESFGLYKSWSSTDGLEGCDSWQHRFELIWENEMPGIRLWTVSEWIEDPLRDKFGEREPDPNMRVPKPDDDPSEGAPVDKIEVEPVDFVLPSPRPLVPEMPEDWPLRDYQKDAINGWIKAGWRGIFAMATGTGKTITALAAATTASKFTMHRNEPLLVLVVVPLVDLVEQWRRSAERFGFRPAVCHGSLSRTERNSLERALQAARAPSGQRTEMVITTAGSLTPTGTTTADDHYLQERLSRHRGWLLVIGDEMHSLGTGARLAALPRGPHPTLHDKTMVLGLSATPTRHRDDEGTEALVGYFGDPAISISIKEAIYKYDALVPYDYHPSFVSLTGPEAETYRKISAQIAAAAAAGDETKMDTYIRKRTRLTQHAANKMSALADILADMSDRSGLLVYVAEGWSDERRAQRTGDASDDQSLKTLSEAITLMRSEFGMRVEAYTGETPPEDRSHLQAAVISGQIDALVAMKCLDEGVDIPDVRTGIVMASTQNPRQFVQRRGRLLRKAPGKSRATIHDLLVMPPAGHSPSGSELTLIGNELSRAYELAEAADNSHVRFDVREEAIIAGLDPEEFTWMNNDAPLERWT